MICTHDCYNVYDFVLVQVIRLIVDPLNLTANEKVPMTKNRHRHVRIINQAIDCEKFVGSEDIKECRKFVIEKVRLSHYHHVYIVEH